MRGVANTGRAPGSAADTRATGGLDALVPVRLRAVDERSEGRGQRLPEGDAAATPAPREGDDDLLAAAAGARPYGEPGGARAVRDQPDDVGHQAHHEPLPLVGVGSAGPHTAQAEAVPEHAQPLLVGREVAGALQADLDRRAGEVEVGPLQDAHLGDGDRRSTHAADSSRPPATSQRCVSPIRAASSSSWLTTSRAPW